MTSVVDLPDAVIRQILVSCTQDILRQLLKSNVAAIAYSILYKQVFLRPKHVQVPMASLLPEYTDTSETDPLELCGSEVIKAHLPGKSGQFCNARELLLFYRFHPLFEPHTFTYFNNKDLVEVEEWKPGFLKKFKYLSYIPSGYDEEIVFDITSYDFDIFTSCKSNTPENYPKSIKVLVNPTNCPNTSMPSVKELVIGLEKNFTSFDKFPNLVRLKLNSEVTFQLDIPSLRFLIVTAGEVDLSKLNNLQKACVKLTNTMPVVGYSADCKIRLPDNLLTLQLENAKESHQIRLNGGGTLKELSISFSNTKFMDVSAIEIPSNLSRLAISGKGLSSEHQQFPKFIEYLTLNGFDLISPVYPPDLIGLNLIGSYSRGTDIENLKRLVTVRVSQETLELPPHLENLQYEENGFNHHPIINDLKNLKCCKISYGIPTESIEIRIPSSMKTLILDSPFFTFKGGENLTTLKLTKYSSTKRISLLGLKSLKVLTLDDPNPVHDSLELPKISSSVEVLILISLFVSNSFSCPKNLRSLQLTRCNISSSTFTLNDNLEYIYLVDVDLNGDSFFKKVGKSLNTLYMYDCRLNNFAADFRTTHLQRFYLQNCTYNKTSVRFPKSLQMVNILDTDDDNYLSFLDWADFSSCDQLCEFYCCESSSQTEKKTERLETLLEQIPKNINDAGGNVALPKSKDEEKNREQEWSQKWKFW